jgi:hypothetical protein
MNRGRAASAASGPCRRGTISRTASPTQPVADRAEPRSPAARHPLPLRPATPPQGFGKFVHWDEDDVALALVVFLNAADPLGVGIFGVTQGDTIEPIGSTGIASFSEDIENEGISSFIGIVAAGAKAGAAAYGAPEAAPLIDAGAKFAQDRFKEKLVKTMRRDAFGVDPGTGVKARCEGGVLVCMPSARGAYYSGDGRCIKAPGDRIDANRPAHLGRNAFFLRRGMGKTMSREGGDMYILAWDHIFEDNFGFYRLHLLLKRGALPPPPPPVEYSLSERSPSLRSRHSV